MRSVWLLTLVAAIAVTAGMMAVFGGAEESRSILAEPGPTTTIPLHEQSSTTTVVVLHADLVGSGPLSEDEEAILAEILEPDPTTTTTTTLPPAPSTTSQPAPKPTPKPTTTTQPPATTAPAPPGQYRGDFESDFYSQINSTRSGTGLPQLTRIGSLDSRARWWAQEMAARGKLSHSNLNNLLGEWSAAGENVGKGGSVSSVFNALMASSGHYSVMVGDFTHVGVGVWQDAGGTIWTVHVFTR
jgi:uncharacterized protein YkwD